MVYVYICLVVQYNVYARATSPFSLGRAPLPTPFLFPLFLSIPLSFSLSHSIKALQGVPRQARHQASFPAPFSLRRRLQRHLLSSISVAGLVLERALHEVSYLRAPPWGPVFLRAPGAVPYLLAPSAVPYFYAPLVPYFYAPPISTCTPRAASQL